MSIFFLYCITLRTYNFRYHNIIADNNREQQQPHEYAAYHCFIVRNPTTTRSPDELVHGVFQEVAQNQALAEETRGQLFELLVYYHCGDLDTDRLVRSVYYIYPATGTQNVHFSLYSLAKRQNLITRLTCPGKACSPKTSCRMRGMKAETRCFW